MHANNESELTLYIDHHWISPYALSCFVALEELGVPYTLQELSLANGQHRAPGYQALTGRVPALRHGDFWLAESQAIDEYLSEVFGTAERSLYPRDARERAVARQIQAWLRSDLEAIRSERSTHTIWYAKATEPLTTAGQQAAARLLAAAQFWVGERTQLFAEWSIADADLALMLRRLLASDASALPSNLRRYVEVQWSRPSLVRWDTHARPTYQPY